MHVQTATAAVAGPLAGALRTPRHGRWFFVGMAVAAAVTVFIGFARTYYLKTRFPMPSFPWLFHLHGALFTVWMLLLVLQASLVDYPLHFTHPRTHRTRGERNRVRLALPGGRSARPYAEARGRLVARRRRR